jgi:hypothetical protein
MSKIEQVKNELASARQKYDECILNPVKDYAYDWEGSQADHYYEEIREKLEEYAALLETEVERLRDELSAYENADYIS